MTPRSPSDARRALERTIERLQGILATAEHTHATTRDWAGGNLKAQRFDRTGGTSNGDPTDPTGDEAAANIDTGPDALGNQHAFWCGAIGRIEDEVDTIVRVNALATPTGDALKRLLREAEEANSNDHCAHCLTIGHRADIKVDARGDRVYRHPTIEARFLCGWCGQWLGIHGHLPPEQQLRQHAAGRRVRVSA